MNKNLFSRVLDSVLAGLIVLAGTGARADCIDDLLPSVRASSDQLQQKTRILRKVARGPKHGIIQQQQMVLVQAAAQRAQEAFESPGAEQRMLVSLFTGESFLSPENDAEYAIDQFYNTVARYLGKNANALTREETYSGKRIQIQQRQLSYQDIRNQLAEIRSSGLACPNGKPIPWLDLAVLTAARIHPQDAKQITALREKEKQGYSSDQIAVGLGIGSYRSNLPGQSQFGPVLTLSYVHLPEARSSRYSTFAAMDAHMSTAAIWDLSKSMLVSGGLAIGNNGMSNSQQASKGFRMDEQFMVGGGLTHGAVIAGGVFDGGVAMRPGNDFFSADLLPAIGISKTNRENMNHAFVVAGCGLNLSSISTSFLTKTCLGYADLKRGKNGLSARIQGTSGVGEHTIDFYAKINRDLSKRFSVGTQIHRFSSAVNSDVIPSENAGFLMLEGRYLTGQTPGSNPK